MMKDIKGKLHTGLIWLILVILCLVTFILATETLGILLAGNDDITLEKTAAVAKDIKPTGELYLLSSIQEDYIMSSDPNVQRILTSFKVNLGQNIVDSSELAQTNDCSSANLSRIRQTIDMNNRMGKYAENLDLKQFISLCEEENRKREAEKSKAFVITISEKCGYYIDFADAEHKPQIKENTPDTLQINFTSDAMKVKCMPQKIQFLSNAEDFWAENTDDRPIDQIKEMLEKQIITGFTEHYKKRAEENASSALKSLFCAMKYETIIINGTTHLCQSH